MINDKIGKLISELDTATGMLTMASVEYLSARRAKEKITNVSFELGNLIQDIETEKAIDNCRVRILEMMDDGVGDCGADENGRCIGYSNSDGGEPCDECQECIYSVHCEEE